MNYRTIKDTEAFNKRPGWKRRDSFEIERGYLVNEREFLERDIDWLDRQAKDVGYSAEAANIVIEAVEKIKMARKAIDGIKRLEKIGD